MEKLPKNIVLNCKENLGESFSYKEVIPEIIGTNFPKTLKMSEDLKIYWDDDPSLGIIEVRETKEIIKPDDVLSGKINIIEETTKNLFLVIEEQQSRIDELTDKLNQIINFLK